MNTPRFFVAASALLIATSLFAQQTGKPSGQPNPNAPPPNAPMDVALPPGMKMPSAGWTAADMNEAAVKKADEFLKQAHKVYSDAAGLEDEALFEVILGDQRIAQKMALSMGKKWDMTLKADPGMTMTVKGDQLYVELKDAPGMFVKATVTKSPFETANTVVPGLPQVPSVALRQHAPEANYATTVFGMGTPSLADLKIVGFREAADGQVQMLLKGSGSEAIVDADGKTHLINKAFYTIPADPSGGMPPLPVVLTYKPRVLETAPAPEFKEEGKKAAESLADMVRTARGGAGGGGGGAGAPPKEKVATGSVAPLSPLFTLEGQPFDLASFKGKVVVLDLWATWCGPCKRGLPLLQQFAEEMKSNPKVAVYAVNSIEQPLQPGQEPTDEYRTGIQKKVGDFWKAGKFTFPTLIDFSSGFMSAYGFDGIPATIIIGPDGKLISAHVGFSPDMVSMLKAEVNKALGEAPAKAPEAGQ